MVAGSEEEFASVRPVLEAMGGYVRRMGPAGAGTAAKLVNQLLTGIHIVAATEVRMMISHRSYDQVLSRLLSRSSLVVRGPFGGGERTTQQSIM
jgi:3-hydroxyisobutyrate dehydrogenase-like beta-hydroxyacid dehydrogenase